MHLPQNSIGALLSFKKSVLGACSYFFQIFQIIKSHFVGLAHRLIIPISFSSVDGWLSRNFCLELLFNNFTSKLRLTFFIARLPFMKIFSHSPFLPTRFVSLVNKIWATSGFVFSRSIYSPFHSNPSTEIFIFKMTSTLIVSPFELASLNFCVNFFMKNKMCRSFFA